ncbi:hypothetical protein BU17DRAFT_87753 [Hysterangium stoloniferum]|nr:hypothetical protein BU17DRAFT_87753 [Hysterangium stoloniferum]
MNSGAATSDVERLLKAVGDDVIRAYRDKYFPARIIEACPNVYAIENAATWINFERFAAFVAQSFQERSPTSSPSPDKGSAASMRSDPPISKQFILQPVAFPPPKRIKLSSNDTMSPTTPENRAGSGESEAEDNDAGPSDTLKRKRSGSQNPTRLNVKKAAGMIQVTRQSWVDGVELVKDAPEFWRVPLGNRTIAYVLDLTEDAREFLDLKGKPMAMSAIIKQKCKDAWSGGTGGSLAKATTVPLLGEGIKCQKMSHECRGVFLCSRADPNLWQDYNREDREVNSKYPLLSEQDEQIDPTIDRSHFEQPVFVVKEKCLSSGGRCTGKPMFKQDDYMFPMNDGQPFIGCSEMTGNGPSTGHFFRAIPRDIDHRLLEKLFNTGIVTFSDTLVFNRPCTFTVPPRTGHKQKHCPHIHVENGEIYEALMLQRACPAKITIFSPINHELRKGVVIPAPGVQHNHPFCPWDKRSRREKAQLRAENKVEKKASSMAVVTGVQRSSMVQDPLNCLPSSAVAPCPPGHLQSDNSLSTALLGPGYSSLEFYA